MSGEVNVIPTLRKFRGGQSKHFLGGASVEGGGQLKNHPVQGDFFNWDSPENVSRLAPPQKCFDWPPPKLSKCWNHIHFARHLGVFRSEGGPVWDSNVFFLNQLLTGQHLANSGGGGQLKKSPCIFLLIFIFLYTASGDVKVFLSPCSSFKMAH